MKQTIVVLTGHLKRRKTSGPKWIEFLVLLSAAILSPYVTYLLTKPAEVSTAQNQYTERKINVLVTLSGILYEGRDPIGTNSGFDYLPVHSNLDTLRRWWNKVNKYYQENWIFFDKKAQLRFERLNEKVFQQMRYLKDTLKEPLNDSIRHFILKDSLIKQCESLINWFRKDLESKYEISSDRRYRYDATQVER
jgi:hypothetical protein